MEDDAGLFRVDGVDGYPARETPAELDHALGEANLSEALIALFLGDVLGRLAAGAVAAPETLVLGGYGSIIDDLIVDGLVGLAQGRVKDGEKPQPRWDNGTGRCQHPVGGRGRGRREEWFVWSLSSSSLASLASILLSTAKKPLGHTTPPAAAGGPASRLEPSRDFWRLRSVT